MIEMMEIEQGFYGENPIFQQDGASHYTLTVR